MKLRLKESAGLQYYQVISVRGIPYLFTRGQVLEIPDQDAEDILKRFGHLIEKIEERPRRQRRKRKEE